MLMRGDNDSAVSWVDRCGGPRDRRAGLLMRLMGPLEIKSCWCHVAKDIQGVDNVLAEGISRWPEDQKSQNILQLIHDTTWTQRDIGQSGMRMFDGILQDWLPEERLNDEMWRLMNPTAHD